MFASVKLLENFLGLSEHVLRFHVITLVATPSVFGHIYVMIIGQTIIMKGCSTTNHLFNQQCRSIAERCCHVVMIASMVNFLEDTLGPGEQGLCLRDFPL